MRALVILAALLSAGCRDEQPPEPPPARVPPQVGEALAQIAASGVADDYAALGVTMLKRGQIVVVAEPAGVPGYLGWADLTPPAHIELAERLMGYPPEQVAYVLLHELVHIRSTEQTHLGPWWGVLDDYERATAQEE